MYLTNDQWATLNLLIDAIVPPDAFAGATDAGVGNYFERQFGRDLAPLLPLYRFGLDALEAESAALYRMPSTALSDAQRTHLLTRLERGETITEWPAPAAEFFHLVVDHTLEGYYGDPANGGNRDEVSWDMIGYRVTA